MSIKLPHEDHVPTLPAKTSTGEKYISFQRARPRNGQNRGPSDQQYLVFPGSHSSRGSTRQRSFRATNEGFWTAIKYRDAVLAEQVFETVLPEVRELLEPETFTERVKILTVRQSRDASFRKRVLAKYGSACVCCGYDTHVEAAHLIAVKDGGTDAVTNGRPLCPNHHWELDNDALSI
jgi:hypothetical protein